MRKVISFALLFTMLLSLCSINIMAAPSEYGVVPDDATDEYKKIFDTFTSLGFLEEFLSKYEPNATMHRDNFSGVLAEFLNMNYPLAVNTKFSDVTSENPYSGAIAALASVGVLNGDDNGLFHPSDEIASEEVIAALVNFLGYEVYAQGKGGYPAGYIATASRIGLTDGVNVIVGQSISQAEFLKLMYNFIKIDVLQQTAFGTETKFKTEDGVTIIAKNFDIFFSEGKVYGTPYSMVDSASTLPQGKVQIGTTSYIVNYKPVEEMLGYEVEYFYKKNRNTYSNVLYASKTEGYNDTVTVLPENEPDVRSGRLYYYDVDTGKERYVKLDGSLNMIYNGVYTTYDASRFNINEGSIVFLDSNSDGIYELVFINDVYHIVVSSVNASINAIFDKYDASKNISYDNSEDKTFKIVDTSGNEFDISKLREWDILSVKKSLNGSIIVAVLERNIVRGAIEGITYRTDGSVKTIRIGENRYPASKTLRDLISGGKIDDITNLKGRELALYLSDSGNVVTYAGASKRAGTLGYLVSAEIIPGARQKMKLDIITENTTRVQYQFAEKVYINGSTTPTSYVTLQNNGVLYNFTNYKAVRQLIMYTTNSNEEINRIWYWTSNNPAGPQKDELYKVFPSATKVYYSGGTQRMLYDDTIMLANPGVTETSVSLLTDNSWRISDDAIVFRLPSDREQEDFYLAGNVSYLSYQNTGYETIYFTPYNISGDDHIIDVVLYTDWASAPEKKPMAVSEVSYETDDEGEEITVVTGLVAGEEKTYKIYDTRSTKTYEITPGDLIACGYNQEGKIVLSHATGGNGYVRYNLDYRPSSSRNFGEINSITCSLSDFGRNMVATGVPMKTDGKLVYFHPMSFTTKPAPSELVGNKNTHIITPSGYTNIYVFDTKTNKYRLGSEDEIVSYEQDPVNYTPMYVYSKDNSLALIVIFK